MLRVWRHPGVVHGFLGRLRGQSRGAFASLNLSQFVGDDPGDVSANWRRLRAALPDGIQVARVNQVHGNEVRWVTRANVEERPAADGMITTDPGIVLGIFTADCVPVLMVASGRRIACALHAGWRGVIAGIASNGVRAMTQAGARPDEINAALGPSIGPCCFEVDADLADRFIREIPSARDHARAGRPGKANLNLRAIVRDQLIVCGLSPDAIDCVGQCTRCASDQFFSRRAAGGATTGLQMSFVGFARE